MADQCPRYCTHSLLSPRQQWIVRACRRHHEGLKGECIVLSSVGAVRWVHGGQRAPCTDKTSVTMGQKPRAKLEMAF